MSNAQQLEATATVRLIGQEIDICEVPANILVRALNGLQQIVYLLVASQEKRDIKKRFRVSEEVQQIYTLHCQIPKQGSYAIPIVLKPSVGVQPSISGDHSDIINRLESFFSSITNSYLSKIQDIFPDSKLRNRALFEARKFLPKADESWYFGFSKGEKEIIVTNKTSKYIDQWLSQDTSEDAVMTVTGELIRIDFDRHVIVLRYPPTHREIECVYLEELEDSLIDNRRQMIQVTGQFTLDVDGNPIKLTDVTRIEPLDLSSLVIREVSDDQIKLNFKTPLILNPTMDEDTNQLLIVENSTIGLQVFAYTREELIYEINEQITMMWAEYVLADKEDLATDALELRERLAALIQEV